MLERHQEGATRVYPFGRAFQNLVQFPTRSTPCSRSGQAFSPLTSNFIGAQIFRAVLLSHGKLTFECGLTIRLFMLLCRVTKSLVSLGQTDCTAILKIFRSF